MSRQIIGLVMLLVVVISPLYVFAQDNADGVVDQNAEVGILPTNPFYFLKEWGRGVQRAFIFDPVRRAEFELEISTEKSDELDRVNELSNDEDAILKAAENYERSMNRLRDNLERLRDTSNNPRVDNLLENLTDRISRHQEVLDKVSERAEASERLRERIQGTGEHIGDVVRPVLERLDSPERLKERIERISGEEGEDRLRLLRIVDRAREGLADGELVEKFSDVREEIEIRIKESDLSATSAARMIEEAKAMFTRLEQYVRDNGLTGQRAEAVLTEARAHIDAAVGALEAGRPGEAFGQANAAVRVIHQATLFIHNEAQEDDESEEKEGDDREGVRIETETRTDQEFGRRFEQAIEGARLPDGTNPFERLGEFRNKTRIRFEQRMDDDGNIDERIEIREEHREDDR